MWVYILFSEITGRYYTGHTSDLEDRLIRHNSARSKSTKSGIPWKLVWSTEAPNRSAAALIENKIKQRGAQRFLNEQ